MLDGICSASACLYRADERLEPELEINSDHRRQCAKVATQWVESLCNGSRQTVLTVHV